MQKSTVPSALKHRTRILALMAAACVSMLCSGCKYRPVDYSQAAHWLSAPAPVKAVDVFYLYPTAWQKDNASREVICRIDNPQMLQGALSAYNRQATAFETFANVYAPYYRQADAGYTLSLPEDERARLIGGIPATDAVAAFEYYLEHYNGGRPFLLAGHSQGSNILLFLLSGYLKDHPDVYVRMIAAYVIGYPVTADYLADNPHLKFAEGADDLGAIISYNTQAPDVEPGANPVTGDMVGLVINPLTWTRDETLATVDQGLGSYMPDPATLEFSKVPQYADARIDIALGVLLCGTADEDALYPLTKGFGRGVYHSFDYPFYYFNIQANAENRAARFLEQ